MSEPTTITVAVHDTLPEVLDRLRGAGDSPVRLEIPAGSPLFLTANEFRALRTAVDREKLSLAVASGDPLRQQLAAMFDLSRNEERGTRSEERGARSEDKRSSTQTSAWTAPVATSEGAGSDDGELPRRNEDSEPATPSSSLAPRSSFLASRFSLIVGGGAAVILVVALGFVATYFFLPRATVAIELKREPLSDELILGIAPEGAPALPDTDLTVSARPIVADVTVTLSTPATGEKLLPDKPAGGPLRLSNPTAQEITIPQGTEVTSANGVTFAFTEAVTVPAAKDGQPSFVDTQVVATGGGAAGNLDLGALSGKLDAGVYYANRMGAFAGGTDRAVRVVSEADLEKLRREVEDALRDQAASDFQGQLQSGEQVVGASIELGDVAESFDQQVDAEAETVAMTATARVTAIKYNAAEAVSQADEALRARLAAAAPDGYELAPSTVVLEGPVLLDESPDGARFRITATASAAASFPPAARDRLANELKGKDDDEVAAVIAALPGVESFDVSFAPGFLAERMPRVAGQIRIETDV